MGFFGGWATVPGIKDLNEDIGGLKFNPYVRGAGQGRLKKDAGAVIKGEDFFNTGLGAGMKSGIMSDAANNQELRMRTLGSTLASGAGMYNPAYGDAMRRSMDRESKRDTMDQLAEGRMAGSQYLIGQNRMDRQNQQDYNNMQSMFDLDKYKTQSGNLLQGTQRTGGAIGAIGQIGGLLSSFTPAGALSKGIGGFLGGFRNRTTPGGPGSGGG